MQPTNPYAPPRYDQPNTGYTPDRSGGSYEFTPQEETIISELAGAMRFVGVFVVVIAVLFLLGALAALFAAPPVGILYGVEGVVVLLLGVWTTGAARAFRLVVDTQGNDIPNLMSALFDLRRVYNLMRWLLVLTLFFVIAGVVMATMLFPRYFPR